MNWERWLVVVEKFLAANHKRFSFRGEGATLWDALWERHERGSGCDGPLAEIIDRDAEYRIKECAPGGEYHENYAEWLKRGDREDGDGSRAEFAWDDINDQLQSYYKREKSTKRSKCGTPSYFDHLEDADDDIDVAGAIGVVELSKRELVYLGRLYKKAPKRYENLRRVAIARRLVKEITALGDKNNLIDIAKLVGLCFDCCGPLCAEDKFDTWFPDAFEIYKCPNCSSESSWRDANAVWHYIMESAAQGRDCHQYYARHIPDLAPRLPHETDNDMARLPKLASHLVTVLEPFRSAKSLSAWVKHMLAHHGTFFLDTGACPRSPDQCLYIEYISAFTDTCVGLGIYRSGYVVMGGSSPEGHPGHWIDGKDPTREQLEECRSVLLSLGVEEADYGQDD